MESFLKAKSRQKVHEQNVKILNKDGIYSVLSAPT